MRCTYQIVTTPQPRVLARVLQLFDQQGITLQTLVLTQTEIDIRIRLSAEIEPALASRLRVKLLHLLAVEDVQLETTSIHDEVQAR